MIDTFLFDLDGTLLPIDMDEFEKTYVNEMGKSFHDMIEPEQLIKHIWTATKAMVSNLEKKPNEKVFMDKFGEIINGDLNIYKERFERFYDEGFLTLREAVVDVPIMRESINMLK